MYDVSSDIAMKIVLAIKCGSFVGWTRVTKPYGEEYHFESPDSVLHAIVAYPNSFNELQTPKRNVFIRFPDNVQLHVEFARINGRWLHLSEHSVDMCETVVMIRGGATV